MVRAERETGSAASGHCPSPGFVPSGAKPWGREKLVVSAKAGGPGCFHQSSKKGPVPALAHSLSWSLV